MIFNRFMKVDGTLYNTGTACVQNSLATFSKGLIGQHTQLLWKCLLLHSIFSWEKTCTECYYFSGYHVINGFIIKNVLFRQMKLMVNPFLIWKLCWYLVFMVLVEVRNCVCLKLTMLKMVVLFWLLEWIAPKKNKEKISTAIS